MATGPTLLEQVAVLAERAARAYAGSPHAPIVAGVQDRLGEPLRVAIAGKVKAGKSTLLNALVGERLAPTDASECTNVVTWYRNGFSYRVSLQPRGGRAIEVPFERHEGSLDISLGGRAPSEVESLTVEWPSSSLARMTLIDTPGLDSLTPDLAERARTFPAPDDERPTPADAVVYLLRHLHVTDLDFLEAFHEGEFAQPSPVNALAVLSRADEIGVGRIDSMTSARRIAARYRDEPKLRAFVQTVVPVAGLLAETSATLREHEFRAVRDLADAPKSQVEALLLSADRFRGESDVAASAQARTELLDRLGLFGVRLSVGLVRSGRVSTSTQLVAELTDRSGLDELRQVLLTHFASRRNVLKARSALLTLARLSRVAPTPRSDQLAAEIERVVAGAHEFAEIRLYNELRTGVIEVRPGEGDAMERLLGGAGNGVRERLGIDESSTDSEALAELGRLISMWRARAENPLSSPALADAAGVLVRTCEGLYMQVSASDRRD